MIANPMARWQFAAGVSFVSLLLLVWPGATDMLMWDRIPIADGQIWRSMTGHLVHLSAWHCLSNLLGLLLICEYLWDELGLTEVCALWLGTATGTSLLL